jgi:3-hydroxyisobutyrate dehydrogenase-like beta-hydroxyacid dehydrogenase
MMSGDYSVNFLMSLMRKDVGYAFDEARRHGVDLSMAAATRALFDKAIAAGLGDQDFAAVAESIRSQKGSTR